MRSTSWEFAAQVRRLLHSFPLVSGDAQSSNVTFSFIVEPPSKDRNIRIFHFAYRDDTRVGRTTSYWHLFRLLEVELDLFIADQVNDRYLLHAGAVSRNEKGIILPGPSESGKSSLSLALTSKGYRYLSDELAVLDPSSGELHPFPKPVSIKDKSVFPDIVQNDNFWLGPENGDEGNERPVWYVHPEDVASGSISPPVPVRYIIFPRYNPDEAPRLQALRPDEALRKLIDNSVNFARFGRNGLRLLSALVADARCFSLSVNGLAATTSLIDELAGN